MKNLKFLLFIICLVFSLIVLLPHFILLKTKREITFVLPAKKAKSLNTKNLDT